MSLRTRVSNRLYPSGEAAYGCKLSDKQVLEIRNRYATSKATMRFLAAEYHVSAQLILNVIKKRTRKNL